MAVNEVTVVFLSTVTIQCAANITVYGKASHQPMLNIDFKPTV